MPEADVKRCKEWGDAIKRIFSNCVGSISGQGEVVQLNLLETKTFDHIVLQEDIREGERVRKYSVEVKQGDTWHAIASGSCIGHKRIHRLDTAVSANQIRVKVGEATATPKIRKLALYLSRDAKVNTEQSPGSDSLKAAPQE